MDKNILLKAGAFIAGAAGMTAATAQDASAQQTQTKTDTLINKNSVVKDPKTGLPLTREQRLKIARETKTTKAPEVRVSAMPNLSSSRPKTQKVEKDVPLNRAERIAAYKLRRSKMTPAQRAEEDRLYLLNKKKIDAAYKKSPATKTIIVETPVATPVTPVAPMVGSGAPQTGSTEISRDTTDTRIITKYVYNYKTDTLDVIAGKGPWAVYGGVGLNNVHGTRNVKNGMTQKVAFVGLESRAFGADGTFGSNFKGFVEGGAIFQDEVAINAYGQECGCPSDGILNAKGSSPLLFANAGIRAFKAFPVTSRLSVGPFADIGVNVTQRDQFTLVKGKRLTPDQEKAQDVVALYARGGLKVELDLGKEPGKGFALFGNAALYKDTRTEVLQTPRNASDPTNLPKGDFAVDSKDTFKSQFEVGVKFKFGSKKPIFSPR
jgi:hypothetical protein